MKTYDVVIIGAGLAGLQCAQLLARRGAKILLVDRKTDLSKGVHTTGIFVRKTLEDFDFPAGTLGPAVRHVTLYSPRLRSIELASEKDEFRVGKMGALYQSLLADCLENGVEFASGTRYIAAVGAPASLPAMSAKTRKTLGRSKRSSGMCFLRPCGRAAGKKRALQTVVRLERNGQMFEVLTRVLIGADGAASRVAKDLGLDENREWIVGYEEVYHRQNSGGEPRLHCFLDGELAPGYLAWIADDGEEIHIGVGGYAAQFNPREALKSLKDKTARIFDLNGAKLAETRGGRIPVGGVLRRIAGERGLLVGDAAGAVSPLTAGGLDPALRLSRLAAEIVWKRLRTNDAGVLLNYSGELFRARFVSRLWMRRLIRTFTNQTLVELGFAFLGTGFGQKFARHVFFGRGSFPDVEIEKIPLGGYQKFEI